MSETSDLYFRQVQLGEMANFVYLIGAIIVQDGSEETLSFWADDKGGEAKRVSAKSQEREVNVNWTIL